MNDNIFIQSTYDLGMKFCTVNQLFEVIKNNNIKRFSTYVSNAAP